MDKPEEITFAWLLLIGISITFVLALAVVLFVVFYQRKLYKQRMEMALLKANQKKEQIEAALIAQEKERERIARDLHDEVGATLSTAKLLLSNTSQQDKELVTAQKLVTSSIGNLRNISHNLLPPTLEDFGLVKALEALFASLEDAEDLQINFNHQLRTRLDKAQEVQVYRIVHELVNNTLKHAQATQIDVNLQRLQGRITLQYRDNGKGFDMDLIEKGGLGLRNLENRVEMLGGTCSTQSKIGEGLRFEMEFEPEANNERS